MIGDRPICMNCKHYIDDQYSEGFKCQAFPEGIPDEIISAFIEHTKTYLGDHDIQYEPKDIE